MKVLSVFGLLFIAMITACTPSESTGEESEYITKDITWGEFQKMDLSQYHLIDVRTPEEYTEGNVGGSLNIDWYNDNFPKRMSELSKDKPTIIYCRSGGRSKNAMNKISGADFPELYNVLGGYLEYPGAQ